MKGSIVGKRDSVSLALCTVPFVLCAAMQAGAAVKSDIIGKVDRIIVDNPTDTWSRGTMVVSGRNIIIPRNMVIDLPANRMTLQQLFVNAPSLCAAIDDNGDGIPDETGLAKGDHCNGTGTGAAATILGNKTNAGDLIAGEIMLEKAAEVVTGVISYIDYSQGYFRVNGIPGDTSTGLMIRIDDPEGRHTHQLGLGCNGSGPNCSADTRYGVDPDNYTFTASTGYPMCIPSTSARGPFDFAVMNPDGTIGPVQTNLTAQAASDGTGDILCPAGNHVPGTVGGDAVDSRLFAPIQLGDHVVAEGNYEHIAGVTFLSAHTATVSVGITTLNVPTQPDYLIFDEVGWDVSGYQNLRARDLLIGFTTIADPGVDIFGLYGDPATNTFKELVFATTVGCDIAAGVGTCTAQGLVGNNGIFKIVHDVDFINANLGVLPIARRSPCQQLNAAYLNGGIPDANGNFITTDPKGRCTGALTINKEFEVLVPPTRDIIGRSRHKHTLAPGIVTLDFHGRESQNGQYLNPVGITHPEFVEINLAALNTAYIFSGEPWNLDRRLGPGGCDGACESTATVPMGDPSMRLDPFPFSALDPGTPDGLAPSPAGTGVPVVSPHTTQRGRILSYWPLTGQELPWPPADPPYQGIVPTATVTNLMCTTL